MEVESEFISAIRYDRDHARMWVSFRSGAEYRYDLVPESVYRAFVRAGSKGAFFGREVRDRYPCTRERAPAPR